MKVSELVKTAGEKSRWLPRTWTMEELHEDSIYREEKGQPYDLQTLFCLTKALYDPSPDVKEDQERMRRMKIKEEDIISFSILREMKHFCLPWGCAEAIMDGTYSLMNGVDEERIGTMEQLYERDIM